jgi:hypothetical protein
MEMEMELEPWLPPVDAPTGIPQMFLQRTLWTELARISPCQQYQNSQESGNGRYGIPQEGLNSVTRNPRKTQEKSCGTGRLRQQDRPEESSKFFPLKAIEPARMSTLGNVAPGRHTNSSNKIDPRKPTHDDETKSEKKKKNTAKGAPQEGARMTRTALHRWS